MVRFYPASLSNSGSGKRLSSAFADSGKRHPPRSRRLIAFLDASDEYVMTEREYDDCDREDCFEDDEPYLGSLDGHYSQERWASGGSDDLEQDLAESGIADLDGLLEQVGTQDWQQGAMA